MNHRTETVAAPDIAPLIHSLRDQRVILDSDLARIYGVETRALNQAVRRNQDRFPAEFLFQLTADEASDVLRLRSQIVILKAGRGHHRKYLPFAFTEHGALMAATVLNRLPRQRRFRSLPGQKETRPGITSQALAFLATFLVRA